MLTLPNPLPFSGGYKLPVGDGASPGHHPCQEQEKAHGLILHCHVHGRQHILPKSWCGPLQLQGRVQTCTLPTQTRPWSLTQTVHSCTTHGSKQSRGTARVLWGDHPAVKVSTGTIPLPHHHTHTHTSVPEVQDALGACGCMQLIVVRPKVGNVCQNHHLQPPLWQLQKACSAKCIPT